MAVASFVVLLLVAPAVMHLLHHSATLATALGPQVGFCDENLNFKRKGQMMVIHAGGDLRVKKADILMQSDY